MVNLTLQMRSTSRVVHTLEDVHGVVPDIGANLQSFSQCLDLGEPFFEVYGTLLHRLLLRLHKMERVAAFSSDTGLESCDGVLEQRIACLTNTRGIIVVLVVIGECAPFRPCIDDSVSHLKEI